MAAILSRGRWVQNLISPAYLQYTILGMKAHIELILSVVIFGAGPTKTQFQPTTVNHSTVHIYRNKISGLRKLDLQ